MNTLSFPQITVSYKDADASKRVRIHSSKESYDILKTFYEDCMQHHEECWAMYLNGAGRLLGVSCVSRSGMNSTVVDIRIVLQTALVSHASGIILSHNHPSGSTVASTPDNNLTSQLKKGCEAIGIQLLDHIILTEDTYLSYMDEGMLYASPFLFAILFALLFFRERGGKRTRSKRNRKAAGRIWKKHPEGCFPFRPAHATSSTPVSAPAGCRRRRTSPSPCRTSPTCPSARRPASPSVSHSAASRCRSPSFAGS